MSEHERAASASPYENLFGFCRALAGFGAGHDDVVRTRVYLTRMEDWRAVGRVHGEVYGAVRPVATMVGVAALIDPEWLVEIEAEAVMSPTV